MRPGKGEIGRAKGAFDCDRPSDHRTVVFQYSSHG